MDRRIFLQRLGLGATAIIVAPKLIIPERSLKPTTADIPKKQFLWSRDKIHIRITNSNPDTRSAVMLGTLLNNIDNNIVPPGIKIQVAGSTLHDLEMTLLEHPLRIQGLSIITENPRQFENCLGIYEYAGEGDNIRYSSCIYQPLNYRSAASQNPAIIDAPGFELLLTPKTSIVTEVKANTQVDYIFNLHK